MADLNNNETLVAYFKFKIIKNGTETISIRKVNLLNRIVDIIPILSNTNLKITSVFADDAEVSPSITFDVLKSFG